MAINSYQNSSKYFTKYFTNISSFLSNRIKINSSFYKQSTQRTSYDYASVSN